MDGRELFINGEKSYPGHKNIDIKDNIAKSQKEKKEDVVSHDHPSPKGTKDIKARFLMTICCFLMNVFERMNP